MEAPKGARDETRVSLLNDALQSIAKADEGLELERSLDTVLQQPVENSMRQRAPLV